MLNFLFTKLTKLLSTLLPAPSERCASSRVDLAVMYSCAILYSSTYTRGRTHGDARMAGVRTHHTHHKAFRQGRASETERASERARASESESESARERERKNEGERANTRRYRHGHGDAELADLHHACYAATLGSPHNKQHL